MFRSSSLLLVLPTAYTGCMSFQSPLRLPNGVTIPNRLAVAPMTTTQSLSDGSVSDAERAWLLRLADDGYGLLLTCAAAVSRDGIAFPNQMSLGDDRFLPGLTRLADALRGRGALPVVQLCHGGARALPERTGRPNQSASAYALADLPGWVPPVPFTEAGLEQLVEDHAAAAARAAEAGFGGVEIHGANGYVFTQFLSTMSNARKDRWGGTLVNRARLAREVVRAIRARVPGGFVVGFRLSFESFGMEHGLDIDEMVQVLDWLGDDGVDYGHISHLDFAAPSTKHPDRRMLAHIRAGVGRGLPLMVAGGVFDAAAADRALELGADIVAIGRAAIGNDRIPARFALGEPLVRPPYPRARLLALGVSPDFQRYLSAPGPVASMRLVAGDPP